MCARSFINTKIHYRIKWAVLTRLYNFIFLNINYCKFVNYLNKIFWINVIFLIYAIKIIFLQKKKKIIFQFIIIVKVGSNVDFVM